MGSFLAKCLITICLSVGAVSAATCTVNSIADNGVGTGGPSGSGDLRYCINQANLSSGMDVIQIAVSGTITLTSSLPTITEALVINGSGPDLLKIDGANGTGVTPFSIEASPGNTVNINDLTVTRGNSLNPKGGGIDLRGGATLNLTNVTLDNNTTQAENGGGIAVTGSPLNIVNSRFLNNHMSAPGSAGGGISLFGGSLTMTGSLVKGNTLPNSDDIGGAGIQLFQVSSARIENSTITGNVNGNYGAGIHNNMSNLRMSNVTVSNNSGGRQAAGVSNVGGIAILRNCTIAGNSVSRFGGGIYNVGNGAVLTLANTIVADNSAAIQGNDLFNFATLTLLGNNIIESPVVNSATINGPGTVSNVDPSLRFPRDFGGPIPTQALNVISPARNAGVNAEALDTGGNPLVSDSRGGGYPRINDGTVDIGAFESPAAGSLVNVKGKVGSVSPVLQGRIQVVMTDVNTQQKRFATMGPSRTYRFANVPYAAQVTFEVIAKGRMYPVLRIDIPSEMNDHDIPQIPPVIP